ncbi:MAG: phosphoglucosamine mutase, partial [Candidatus Atribacteria bacterium]|nr:phosphoglucosamine mutase [Candidatus Atribacteria bacterium]
HYTQIKMKITVDPVKKKRILEEIDRVTAQEKNRVTVDGFKVTYQDGSWLLIRPSGTEPLLRVFAESRVRERAEAIIQEYLALIKTI